MASQWMPREFPLYIVLYTLTSYTDYTLSVTSVYPSDVYNSTACDEPCKNNTFEAMPCVGSNPKICKGKSI